MSAALWRVEQDKRGASVKRGDCLFQESALAHIYLISYFWILWYFLLLIFYKAQTYQSVTYLADQKWSKDYEALTVLNKDNSLI